MEIIEIKPTKLQMEMLKPILDEAEKCYKEKESFIIVGQLCITNGEGQFAEDHIKFGLVKSDKGQEIVNLMSEYMHGLTKQEQKNEH